MLSPDCTVTSTTEAARAHLRRIDPVASTALIDRVSALTEALFEGRHPKYQQADLKYHNLEHTVFATQAFVDLAGGWLRHERRPEIGARRFSLGYAAIMLHDSGYLKTRDDRAGTGAKYTMSHVTRSCVLAESLLPELGCTHDEIEGVQHAIRCTGVNSQIAQIPFRGELDRLIGCMVVTADYLGQMADPHYPEKLPGLFAEFEESNDFNRVPPGKRPFKSAAELMTNTPAFWREFALPKLENDYGGVYRVLTEADGRNPYIEAVESNLERIAAPGGR